MNGKGRKKNRFSVRTNHFLSQTSSVSQMSLNQNSHVLCLWKPAGQFILSGMHKL